MNLNQLEKLANRSKYSYVFRTVKGRKFLMIEDMNKGMSVTNNIENISGYIFVKFELNPIEHYIIYKDSEKSWDGYEFATGVFVHLNQSGWLQAAMKYLNFNK